MPPPTQLPVKAVKHCNCCSHMPSLLSLMITHIALIGDDMVPSAPQTSDRCLHTAAVALGSRIWTLTPEVLATHKGQRKEWEKVSKNSTGAKKRDSQTKKKKGKREEKAKAQRWKTI